MPDPIKIPAIIKIPANGSALLILRLLQQWATIKTQRVVCKWEEEVLFKDNSLPAKVNIVKWLPHQDLGVEHLLSSSLDYLLHN
jgi:hypothetical protein